MRAVPYGDLEVLKQASLKQAPATVWFKGAETGDYLKERSVAVFGGQSLSPRGLALSLTRDGYFITAAHVVDGWMPIRMVFPYPFERSYYSCRVVCLDESADLALLKADMALERVFEPAGQSPLPGDPLLAVGGSMRPSFGEVQKVFPKRLHLGAYVLRHDVPGGPGDSGGPIVAEDGSLVAITTREVYRWFRYWSEGMIPDWPTIRRVIEMDRRVTGRQA